MQGRGRAAPGGARVAKHQPLHQHQHCHTQGRVWRQRGKCGQGTPHARGSQVTSHLPCPLQPTQPHHPHCIPSKLSSATSYSSLCPALPAPCALPLDRTLASLSVSRPCLPWSPCHLSHPLPHTPAAPPASSAQPQPLPLPPLLFLALRYIVFCFARLSTPLMPSPAAHTCRGADTTPHHHYQAGRQQHSSSKHQQHQQHQVGLVRLVRRVAGGKDRAGQGQDRVMGGAGEGQEWGRPMASKGLSMGCGRLHEKQQNQLPGW